MDRFYVILVPVSMGRLCDDSLSFVNALSVVCRPVSVGRLCDDSLSFVNALSVVY